MTQVRKKRSLAGVTPISHQRAAAPRAATLVYNALRDDIPDFNTSHADTTASRERVRRLVRENDAVVILGHEGKDIDDLPAFPKGAE